MSEVARIHVAGLAESARLMVAVAIGVLIVWVQRWTRREQPLGPALEQTSVLLCLAGALVMLSVGDSLPRAFGIAGAAAIIRFRTPVDDARDTTVLFLLMALGISTGLGLYTVALVGTAFVCGCLILMRRTDLSAQRVMRVVVVAEGREFPTSHVSSVFAAHRIAALPIQLSHGEKASVRYRVVFRPDTPLDQVSAQMLQGGAAGISSVSWEAPKKAA